MQHSSEHTQNEKMFKDVPLYLYKRSSKGTKAAKLHDFVTAGLHHYSECVACVFADSVLGQHSISAHTTL